MIKNPSHYAPLMEMLRPIRERLLPPLSAIFRDKERPETERSFATNILADYAGDQPSVLVDLLLDAEPKAFGILYPIAERQSRDTAPVAASRDRQEADTRLERPAARCFMGEAGFGGGQPDRGEPGISRRTVCLLPDDAAGRVSRDCRGTTEVGLPSGPVPALRRRPGSAGGSGLETRRTAVAHCLGRNPEQVRRLDEANRRENFLPVDIAGYLTTDLNGTPAIRYAVVWAQASGGDDARLYIEVKAVELTDAHRSLDEAKLIARSLQVLRAPDGQPRYSGIWGKPSWAGVSAQDYRDMFETNFAENQLQLLDKWLVDVAVSEAGKYRPVAERAEAALELAKRHSDSQARRL